MTPGFKPFTGHSVKDNSGVYAEQSVFLSDLLSDMLVIIISIRMQFKS